MGANERFIAESRLQSLDGAEDRLESVFQDVNRLNAELIQVTSLGLGLGGRKWEVGLWC